MNFGYLIINLLSVDLLSELLFLWTASRRPKANNGSDVHSIKSNLLWRRLEAHCLRKTAVCVRPRLNNRPIGFKVIFM